MVKFYFVYPHRLSTIRAPPTLENVHPVTKLEVLSRR
jgi:hypothetical protein